MKKLEFFIFAKFWTFLGILTNIVMKNQLQSKLFLKMCSEIFKKVQTLQGVKRQNYVKKGRKLFFHNFDPWNMSNTLEKHLKQIITLYGWNELKQVPIDLICVHPGGQFHLFWPKMRQNIGVLLIPPKFEPLNGSSIIMFLQNESPNSLYDYHRIHIPKILAFC